MTLKSGYLVAFYSTDVVRLVAPPHLTKHIREERVGAPTVPAPASTLAPFGLEDHQVPSKVSVSLC
ncbi:hypothetical protein HN51_055316 [Arachis hypogaea]